MVPFEYHWDIFQPTYRGWKVDGDPSTDESTSGVNRDIVWSCKPPDVVLTEAIAWHDRRTADTDWDDGKKKKTTEMSPTDRDPTFDQVQIPQGTAIFELYCTRNPNNPVAPGDLYTLNPPGKPPGWYLDLGRMDAATQKWPVWRMGITTSTRAGTGNKNYDIATQATNHPDSTVFEPTFPGEPGGTDPATDPTKHMNILNATTPGVLTDAPDVPIERVLWLGKQPPTAIASPPAWAQNTFYNHNQKIGLPDTLIGLCQYGIIGPRVATALGSQKRTGAGPWGAPSPQAITLYPTLRVTGPDGNPNYYPTSLNPATDLKPIATMICSADPPGATAAQPWGDAKGTHNKYGIGVNISEPLPSAANYYPEPKAVNASALPMTDQVDAYGDLNQIDVSHGYFLDQPQDSDPTIVLPRPLLKDNMIASGTYPVYKYAFLQRLADPTSPYNPASNPYITVDWIPIDLTVFNGEQVPVPPDPANGNTGPDPDDPAAMNAKVQLTTRERGGSNYTTTATVQPAPNPAPSIWGPIAATDTLPPATAAYNGPGTGVLTAKLFHTLGQLNAAFGPGFSQATAPMTTPAGQYIGDPQRPFPWIAWNARPYASLAELLLVPASCPERLMYEFAYLPSGASAPSPYLPPAPATPQAFHGPYNHLLNFFSSATSTFSVGQAPNFYRALEYMQVPSPFIGTETVLNPNGFPVDGSGGPATATFLPPFNAVSNYRDPGKVNLNTLTAQEVFNAMMNGMPHPTWQEFLDSRRGFTAAGQAMDPDSAHAYPTRFANPFRAGPAADCVPLQNMMHAGVNSTLYRATGITPDSSNAPLFSGMYQSASSKLDAANIDPNAYFRYQGLERISNLVTTRSHVFGIWLTIGRFEAIPWTGPIDAFHADGYMIGSEIGSDTGDVERHRAFYIFDRSIPVAYERGQDNNVNRAILIKRYIE